MAFSHTISLDKPDGEERVDQIDDLIKETRQWVADCFEDISGYPNNTCLIIPSWSENGQRPASPKTGMMGYNSAKRKFQRYNGYAWEDLEYDAYTCRASDKEEGGWAKYAKSATKATQDSSGNVIKDTYVKLSEVDNKKGKIPRFNSDGHLVFSNGAEFWVT